jgi:hypothetical protein
LERLNETAVFQYSVAIEHYIAVDVKHIARAREREREIEIEGRPDTLQSQTQILLVPKSEWKCHKHAFAERGMLPPRAPPSQANRTKP